MEDRELNNWILQHYPKFRFKYWLTTEDYPEISRYMKELLYRSYYESESICEELPEIIHMVEDFFVAGIETKLFHKENIKKILDKMKAKFEYIEYLPKKYSGVYGRTVDEKKCVQINSNMGIYSGRKNLEPDEVRRLYLFHELGHTILNIRNHPMIGNFYSSYSEVMEKKGKSVPLPKVPQLIEAGFFMIEECLTQEMAEKFAYCIARKSRPKYTVHKDSGEKIETNLDYYGIFQKPTINLGTTMRGCGNKKNYSNEAILEGMLKRALNHDFVPDLISEYDEACDGSPEAYETLMNIIIEMGIICDKKYRSFGQGLVDEKLYTEPYTDVLSDALSSVQKHTSEYQDFREYPEHGFPDMNFKKPNTKRRQQLLDEIRVQQNTVSGLRNEKQSLLDRINRLFGINR